MQIPPGGREEALAFEISRTSISIQFHKMLSCSKEQVWGTYLLSIESQDRRGKYEYPRCGAGRGREGRAAQM